MPELAEVETVRADLAGVAIGKTIARVSIHGARTVRRHEPGILEAELPGRTITGLRRIGKYLLVDLDNDQVLVVHLRMSGQLLWKPDEHAELEKHTHARIHFVSGEELRFVDPRTFGELWLSEPDLPEMSHIGPDALNDLPTANDLAQRFAGRKSGLKSLLLNQQVVAGIGNIYSDEMLWQAKLRYSRTPDSLSKPAVARLHSAMKEILVAAVASRGSSLRDQQYVDLYGNTGGAQLALHAYDREHQPCHRCEHPIKRMSFGGRSTFFCPHCQR